MFEWGQDGIAWDPDGKQWVLRSGGLKKFRDLKRVETDNSAEKRHPQRPVLCERLVEKFLTSAERPRSIEISEWSGSANALSQVGHDFMVSLWKMGFPRDKVVFKNDWGSGKALDGIWVGDMPAWATAQLRSVAMGNGKLGVNAFDTWLAEAHSHQALTKTLIGRLGFPQAAVEIVGPPGAHKAGVLQDLVNHFSFSQALRPIFMIYMHPLGEFFARLGRELAEHSYGVGTLTDDAGSIAQALRRSEEPRPLLILRSVSQYFGPNLDDSSHRTLVRHWLSGLEALRDHGGASIVFTTTIPIGHQADPYDDLSLELVPDTVIAGSDDWDGWVAELRRRWEAETPTLQLPWEDLSRQAKGQVGALVSYVQKSKREQRSAELSSLDDALSWSAREIINRLPECCKNALIAVVTGRSAGSSGCPAVLTRAGILRMATNGRLEPAIPFWAEKWAKKWQPH